VVVALGLSLISPQFRTISNGFVLLVNGTVIAFLALGQAFVLLTGGIDLSTGANVAMSGVVAALLMKFGLPWPIASLLHSVSRRCSG
jgi:ribose transport system permease protein